MGAMWTPLANALYRLSITVPTPVKECLVRIKEITGNGNVVEIVTKALTLYEAVEKARSEGRNVVVVRPYKGHEFEIDPGEF